MGLKKVCKSIIGKLKAAAENHAARKRGNRAMIKKIPFHQPISPNQHQIPHKTNNHKINLNLPTSQISEKKTRVIR